jgi:hypothetical protein
MSINLQQMKLFSYILAFYLLLLSAIPCCSFDDCPDDITEQTAKHEKSDEDCGNCSPFFSCEGCATATDNSSIAPFTLSPLSTPKMYTEFIHPFVAAVHYDFWQPPKLG